MREHGVAVPRDITDRAKDYVKGRIERAQATGHKVDPAAKKLVDGSVDQSNRIAEEKYVRMMRTRDGLRRKQAKLAAPTLQSVRASLLKHLYRGYI